VPHEIARGFPLSPRLRPEVPTNPAHLPFIQSQYISHPTPFCVVYSTYDATYRGTWGISLIRAAPRKNGLESWPLEIQELKISRPKQAERLQEKVDRGERWEGMLPVKEKERR
jgi:hypothetical protein